MPLTPSLAARSAWLLAAALLLIVQPAVAQDPAADRPAGTVTLTDWPDTLAAAPDTAFAESDYQLLPRLDALTVAYRYAGQPDAVDLSFVLSWAPGEEGLYEGQVRPYEALPSDIRMVAVELVADVIVDGRDVADMMVAVDSMALPAHPGVYAFEVGDLAYEALFLDTAADSARQYVAQGFTLRNLTVSRVAFASYAERPSRAATDVARDAPPPPPPPRSVYVPRSHIFIGWRIGPTPYYVGPGRVRRDASPRSDTVGRTAAETDRRDSSPERGERAEASSSGRADADAPDEAPSGRAEQEGRSTDRDERSEDDDDEDSLLPASAAAVAVVGAAAIIGGTVGVHGTGRTPLGLMAGWVQPQGGALVQASINTNVLEAEGRQHLEAKLVGFYDAFGAPVQPALGLGAVATAEGDATTVEPSLSIGVAGNFGRVVIRGGIDVVHAIPEVGVAINFRLNPER